MKYGPNTREILGVSALGMGGFAPGYVSENEKSGRKFEPRTPYSYLHPHDWREMAAAYSVFCLKAMEYGSGTYYRSAEILGYYENLRPRPVEETRYSRDGFQF